MVDALGGGEVRKPARFTRSKDTRSAQLPWHAAHLNGMTDPTAELLCAVQPPRKTPIQKRFEALTRVGLGLVGREAKAHVDSSRRFRKNPAVVWLQLTIEE